MNRGNRLNGGRKTGSSKWAVPRVAALFIAAMVIATCAAVAVQPGEQLADPKLEARARALGEELRCMVCQNQSIDDSDAPLAKDLRLIVRERVKAGDSDGEVLSFLTERYGEFVLLRPSLRAETLLLWGFAPAVLGLGLVGYLIWAFRARRQVATFGGLSEQERSRLEALLATEPLTRERADQTDGGSRLT